MNEDRGETQPRYIYIHSGQKDALWVDSHRLCLIWPPVPNIVHYFCPSALGKGIALCLGKGVISDTVTVTCIKVLRWKGGCLGSSCSFRSRCVGQVFIYPLIMAANSGNVNTKMYINGSIISYSTVNFQLHLRLQRLARNMHVLLLKECSKIPKGIFLTINSNHAITIFVPVSQESLGLSVSQGSGRGREVLQEQPGWIQNKQAIRKDCNHRLYWCFPASTHILGEGTLFCWDRNRHPVLYGGVGLKWRPVFAPTLNNQSSPIKGTFTLRNMIKGVIWWV